MRLATFGKPSRYVIIEVSATMMVFGIGFHRNNDKSESWSLFIGPIQVEYCHVK